MNGQSFFCASDSSFFKEGTLRSGLMTFFNRIGKRKSFLVSTNLFLYISLSRVSCGKRQAATVISLWFAELDCDWSVHN